MHSIPQLSAPAIAGLLPARVPDRRPVPLEIQMYWIDAPRTPCQADPILIAPRSAADFGSPSAIFEYSNKRLLALPTPARTRLQGEYEKLLDYSLSFLLDSAAPDADLDKAIRAYRAALLLMKDKQAAPYMPRTQVLHPRRGSNLFGYQPPSGVFVTADGSPAPETRRTARADQIIEAHNAETAAFIQERIAHYAAHFSSR